MYIPRIVSRTLCTNYKRYFYFLPPCHSLLRAEGVLGRRLDVGGVPTVVSRYLVPVTPYLPFRTRLLDQDLGRTSSSGPGVYCDRRGREEVELMLRGRVTWLLRCRTLFLFYRRC